MRWYGTGIVLVGIIVFIVFIGVIIIGLSLWNVPLAKQIFPFLEISEAFPTKAIALFTGLATFGTLLLALATILTIKNNNEREAIRRKDELSKESRERRERLLNEIIEWATQVLECARDKASLQLVFSKSELVSTTVTQAGFNILAWRAVHIGAIAASIGQGLQDAVEDTRTLIRQHSKLLSLSANEKVKHSTAIGRHRDKIDNKAKSVIELAVNLL